MPKETMYMPLGVCLSSSCDRGCKHCSADTKITGNFFTVENSVVLKKSLETCATEMRDHYEIDLNLRFIGDGEPLLNPHLVEILDVLLDNYSFNVRGGIVTSGVNSSWEEKQLLAIINRPYIDRLDFYISFNLFESHFPKRLIRTLRILFENRVKKATIKICQPHLKVYKTIHRLDRILENYFSKWIDEASSAISGDADFWPVNTSEHIDRENKDILGNVQLENAIEKARERLINIRPPTNFDLMAMYVFFQTNHKQTFRFKTKFGEKEIAYLPHFLTKQGRAKNLRDPGCKNITSPCTYLTNDERISHLHIGYDGFYYPSCDCPTIESLRLGHIGDDIKRAYTNFLYFREFLLYGIIADNRPYFDICDLCVKVANIISKKLGAIPMEIEEKYKE